MLASQKEVKNTNLSSTRAQTWRGEQKRPDNAERHLKALPAISSLCLHKSLANYLEIQKPNSTFLEDVKEAKRGGRRRDGGDNHFATTE